VAKGDGIIWSVDIDEDESEVIESSDTTDSQSTKEDPWEEVHGKPSSDQREEEYDPWDIVVDHGSDGGEPGEIYPKPEYTPQPPVPQTEYTTVIRTQIEIISDFSEATLRAYEESGAYAVRVYEDGFEERVPWSEVSNPHQIIEQTIEMMDARARQMVDDVNAEIADANERLDAQAAELETTQETIAGVKGEIDEFKETAEVTYATKTEVDEETGAIVRTLEANYATKEENNASTRPNLSPFYDNPLDDVRDPTNNPDGYWDRDVSANPKIVVSYLGNGWVHVSCDNQNGSGTVRFDHVVMPMDKVKPNTNYTLLFEIRNNFSTGNENSSIFYVVQQNNKQFWGGNVSKVLETNVAINPNLAGIKLGCGQNVTHRVLKTSEDETSSHWTGPLSGMMMLTFLSPAGTVLDFDARLSMYEGEYYGNYKPYVPPTTTLALKHEVEETAERFRRTLTEDYASKDELTGATQNLATKSEVQQTADSITQTVSRTYATKSELEAIQVGATNLLPGTSSFAPYMWYDNTPIGVTISDGIATMDANNTGNYFAMIPVIPGEKYSVSVDVKGDAGSTYTPDASYFMFIGYFKAGPPRTSANRVGYDLMGGVVTTEWTRASKVVTIPNNSTIKYLCAGLRNVNTNAPSLSFRHVKIERGDIPTDWTPSPEDLLTNDEASLRYTSKTEFNQTTDAINLKAEAALRHDPTNMLRDWNAPSNKKIDGPANRYWSDVANAEWISSSYITIANPPEPDISNGVKFVSNGRQTARKGRALAFYVSSSGDASRKDVPYVIGQNYTISMWARCSDGDPTKCTARFHIRGSQTKTPDISHTDNTVSPNLPLTEEWQKLSFTFNMKSFATDYNRVWFFAFFDASTAATIEFCGFKLVPGLNPEAVDGKFSNYVQTSEFNVRTNEISQSVSDALTNAKNYTDYRESAIKTYADNISLSVEAKTTNLPNLSPFFSNPIADIYNASTNPDGYWARDILALNAKSTGHMEDLSDGWVAIYIDNTSSESTGNSYANIYESYQWRQTTAPLKTSTSYTVLVEVKNLYKEGDVRVNGISDHATSYPSMFGGQSSQVISNGEMRFVGTTKNSFTTNIKTTSRTLVTVTPGAFLSCYMRVSLYESPTLPDGTVQKYLGPYKPYVPTVASLYYAKAQIKLNQTNIQSEVEARQDAINGLVIGGKNLLLDTDVSSLNKVAGPGPRYFMNGNLDNAGSIRSANFLPEGIKYVTKFAIPAGNNNVNYALCWYTGATIPLVDGEEYTLSFWAMSDKAAIAYASLGTNPYIKGYGAETITTNWKRHSVTLTFDKSMAGGSDAARAYAGVQCKNSDATNVYICGVKLERGNKATAYEDDSSEITNVSSRITQTATDVTTLFTNSSAGVDISYYSHTSETSAPADTVAWQATMPAKQTGKYIWMKIVTKKFNANHAVTSTTTKTCISGTDGNIVRATCSTASSTSAKEATILSGSLTLKTGALVEVFFSFKNTASTMTLNVGGTGAKNIRAYGQNAGSSALWNIHAASMRVLFVYDGTYWQVTDAAAMHAYVRENSSGLIVGTNYQQGYSYVSNGGGFYIKQKANATDTENISNDTNLAYFFPTSAQIGVTTGNHIYISSSGAIYFRKSATETFASYSGTTITLGQVKSGSRNLYLSTDGLFIRDNTTNMAKFTPSEVVVGQVAANKKNIQITNAQVYIRNNTGVLASFGDAIRFYNGSQRYLYIGPDKSNAPCVQIGYDNALNTYFSDSGMEIRNGSTTISNFNLNTITLGETETNKKNVLINSNGIALRNGTTTVAQFTPTKIDLGLNSIDSTVYLGGSGLYISGYGTGKPVGLIVANNTSTFQILQKYDSTSYTYTQYFNMDNPRDNDASSHNNAIYMEAKRVTRGGGTPDFAKVGVTWADAYMRASNTVPNANEFCVKPTSYSVTNPAQFRSAIGAAASSDIRLKRNVMDLKEEAVDFIRELKPIVYRMNEDRELGLSAQSVMAADRWDTNMAFQTNEGLDEWEKLPDGSPTWKLDYIRLIPPVVKTLQHILDRLDNLESKLNGEEV